mgnify:CR=1 FL=1
MIFKKDAATIFISLVAAGVKRKTKRKQKTKRSGQRKKKVYGNPGCEGLHLSGDVQSPNVSKSIGFGKFSRGKIEPDKLSNLGVRRRVQGPLEPLVENEKKKHIGVENKNKHKMNKTHIKNKNQKVNQTHIKHKKHILLCHTRRKRHVLLRLLGQLIFRSKGCKP